MNEVILLLLGFAGIFLIACSIALIALGRIIDEYPVGDESARKRGIGSPAESTKLAAIFLWALFILGGWAVLQASVYVVIVGITTLFAVCLFMFTALVFSFAVLYTMKQRKKELGDMAIQAAMASPDAPLPQPAASSRRSSRYVPGFMAAMLRKE